MLSGMHERVGVNAMIEAGGQPDGSWLPYGFPCDDPGLGRHCWCSVGGLPHRAMVESLVKPTAHRIARQHGKPEMFQPLAS